jgi:hypothetical protein
MNIHFLYLVQNSQTIAFTTIFQCCHVGQNLGRRVYQKGTPNNLQIYIKGIANLVFFMSSFAECGCGQKCWTGTGNTVILFWYCSPSVSYSEFLLFACEYLELLHHQRCGAASFSYDSGSGQEKIIQLWLQSCFKYCMYTVMKIQEFLYQCGSNKNNDASPYGSGSTTFTALTVK